MSFLRRNKSAPVVPRPAGPPAAPSPEPAAASEPSGRPAPDPLSLILPAFAALGAIASIAAVAWTAEDRCANRPRIRRRVDVILKDLETSGLGLTEILRRIRRNARLLGIDGPPGTASMKFGLNSNRMEPAGGQLYHSLVNDLATMLVLATQNSFDVIAAIEDGEIECSEMLFNSFAEAQERLNALLIQRAGMLALADGGFEVASRLTGLVQQLKTHRSAA